MINIDYTNHWGGQNINSTIQQSIIDNFGRLRYQAKENPKAFRAILEVVVLQDILEWAPTFTKGVELNQIEQIIRDKQKQLIFCNSDFNIQYIDSETAYVNVNTPQTNDTWKRVWDSRNVITSNGPFVSEEDLWVKVENLIIDYPWAEVENLIIEK